MTIGLGHYLSVAAILFTLGILGIFLNRKNIIVILMSVELILLSVNINFVAFSGALGDLKDEAKIAQAYRQALAFVGWIETQYGDLIPYQLVAGQKAGGVAKAFMKATGVDLDTAWTTFAEGL